MIVPNTRTIEQYTLRGSVYELVAIYTEADTVLCQVLAGLGIPVKAVFDTQANVAFLTHLLNN